MNWFNMTNFNVFIVSAKLARFYIFVLNSCSTSDDIKLGTLPMTRTVNTIPDSKKFDSILAVAFNALFRFDCFMFTAGT